MAERQTRRRAAQKGVTLIELLVAIVIIGVLSTIVAINVLPAGDTAKVTTAEAQVTIIRNALRQYKLDMGRYPSEQEGLEALVTPPTDNRRAARFRTGGYLDGRTVPLDPWDRPYVYAMPGEFDEFEVFSYGRDGEPGGEGLDADIPRLD